jgi:hypothetical protein
MRRDRAHPYRPGSGPEGESCGSCAKLVIKRFSEDFFQCHVQRRYWLSEERTDIKATDRACLAWEPATEKVSLFVVR